MSRTPGSEPAEPACPGARSVCTATRRHDPTTPDRKGRPLQVPRAETLRSRTLAIVNPGSGRGDTARILSALKDWLADPAHPGDIHEVRAGDDLADAARRAAASGCGTVIAVGGDGTISTVAEALAGTPAVLGVIPAGTFNYFARSLDIPEETDAALEVIAQGRAKALDLGTINGRVFLNNASVGIYSRIRRQREETYRRFGRSRIAAYWSVLRAILRIYRPMRLMLTVDGASRQMRSSLVFVCASAYQVEQFGMDGADAIRDGKLAVYVSRDRGRWQLIRHAVRLALRGVERGRDFELVTGRDITLDTRRGAQHVVRDGEVERMRGPYRIARSGVRLRVLCPDGDMP